MVEEGDRVELISTNDEYTNLTPGDRGTVTNIDILPAAITGGGKEQQVSIDWDTGSSLALIRGEDRFKVINDE